MIWNTGEKNNSFYKSESMKNYFLLLLILMFEACNNNSPAPDVAVTKEEIKPGETNTAIIKQLYEAFNAHNWEKMAALYIDSASFLDPAYGQNFVKQSHADMVKHYQGLESWSPDVKDSVTFIAAVNENKVLVQFTSTGTMAKEKIKWSLPICNVFTIENGKIVKDETYYDKTE